MTEPSARPGSLPAGDSLGSQVADFLKILGFVLLCGLVGPAFLVCYLLLDEPGTEWMLWTGIGFTVLDVLIAVGLFVAVQTSRSAASDRRLHGQLLLAGVESVQQTGTYINEEPVMRFRLRVDDGQTEPFTAQVKARVPVLRQPLVHLGSLVVLMDPGSRKLHIDWDASALVGGLAPAKFTSVADGRTVDLTGQSEPLLEIISILYRNGLPLDGALDVRDRPEVHRQVMDVLQRWEQASATAPPQVVTDVRTADFRAAAARPGAAGPAASWSGATGPSASGSGTNGPGASGPADSRSADSRSAAERLRELDGLRAAAAISDDEYQRTRARILDTL